MLDGNWGVTKKTPLKYMHMLEWAGYDYLISADSMVDTNLNVLSHNSPLADILIELDCEKDDDEFLKLWSTWKKGRK